MASPKVEESSLTPLSLRYAEVRARAVCDQIGQSEFIKQAQTDAAAFIKRHGVDVYKKVVDEAAKKAIEQATNTTAK